MIPSKVTRIGSQAFRNTRVTGLDLSKATSLVEIVASAFSATDLQGTLVIPSRVRKIGSEAFWDTRLTELDLSGATSLVEIGERAFAETNLEATVGPVAVAHVAEEGREVDPSE